MTKGKFRKETSAAQQKRRTILQTYLTSLVSLVLCVTMFFGTTAAWFTDTVETNQNQMYVGTLDVKLEHASFKNGSVDETKFKDVTEKDYKILSAATQWEPGYTAIEKFRLTEQGTLAFGYELTMAYNFTKVDENSSAEDKLKAAQEEAFTKAVSVWTYTGANITTLPENNFADLVKQDWVKVGTLYDVLNKTLNLFSGEMDAAEVNKKKTIDNVEQDDPAVAEHIIALHLDEDFTGEIKVDEDDKTVQGLMMDQITIRLVATQKASENDAFGPTYDLGATNTAIVYASTVEELQTAVDAAEDGTAIVLNGTVDLDGGRDAQLNLTKDVTFVGGTIKGVGYDGELNCGAKITSGNIVFDGVTFELTNDDIKTGAWGMSVNVSGSANVTFKNCTFKGSQCPIYQSGADSMITLENCKFETTSVAIQCEIYSGDFSLGQDLVVKNCDFTGVEDVLHIYDYDKDPTTEAIVQYMTANGNTFTGTCKQTCK